MHVTKYLFLNLGYVLLGNNIDAWTSGADDPNSGTTILLEA
jgi:hypothetical protein